MSVRLRSNRLISRTSAFLGRFIHLFALPIVQTLFDRSLVSIAQWQRSCIIAVRRRSTIPRTDAVRKQHGLTCFIGHLAGPQTAFAECCIRIVNGFHETRLHFNTIHIFFLWFRFARNRRWATIVRTLAPSVTCLQLQQRLDLQLQLLFAHKLLHSLFLAFLLAPHPMLFPCHQLRIVRQHHRRSRNRFGLSVDFRHNLQDVALLHGEWLHRGRRGRCGLHDFNEIGCVGEGSRRMVIGFHRRIIVIECGVVQENVVALMMVVGRWSALSAVVFAVRQCWIVVIGESVCNAMVEIHALGRYRAR